MTDVTLEELVEHTDDVVDRAYRGEELTITRDGSPVARLGTPRRSPLNAAELLRRARLRPHVDPERLKADLDAVIDPSL